MFKFLLYGSKDVDFPEISNIQCRVRKNPTNLQPANGKMVQPR